MTLYQWQLIKRFMYLVIKFMIIMIHYIQYPTLFVNSRERMINEFTADMETFMKRCQLEEY